MKMPFLGKRHQFWVNDMKAIRQRSLSLKDRLIILLLALLLITITWAALSDYQSSRVSLHLSDWLYLTSSQPNAPDTTDPNWTFENPQLDPYWIKCKVPLTGNGEFNAMQISFPDSYEVYWDGYLIGRHEHKTQTSVTQIFLLDKHHVLPGTHHVMLRVENPKDTFIDISKKQIIAGQLTGLRKTALMKLFLLIAALGLSGMIILLCVKDLQGFQTHRKATVWSLALTITYLGLSLIDTLHHQPFQWSNPSLLALATACCLQLIYMLSRTLPSLLFKSFFSIAAATYVLVYLVLGNPHERLPLYYVSLALTLFFFLQTTANHRVSLFWIVVPLLAFVSPVPGTGALLFAIPFTLLIYHQSFTIKSPIIPTNEQPASPISKPVNYLLVNSKSDKKSIHLSTVAYLKAANNYSIIVSHSGETFLHDKSLLKLSAELPENFRRIHKSYLVNFDQVERVKNKNGGGKLLQLKSGEEVPVGRVYQKELTIHFA